MSKRTFIFRFSFLFLCFYPGCALNNTAEDGTASNAQTTETVNISGSVEFPDSAGTRTAIQAKINLNKYRVYINEKNIGSIFNGTFSGNVPRDDNEQYDIQIRFVSSNHAILRAFISREVVSDEEKPVKVNVQTHAHAIAFIAYKTRKENSSTTYHAFNTLVDISHATVQNLSKKLEKALESLSKIEATYFNPEDEEEVKKEKEKVVEEAKKNENKLTTICHIPPGNPDNLQTITIAESAWSAHEAHGDTKGECPVPGATSTTSTSSSTTTSTTTGTTSTTISTSTSTSTAASGQPAGTLAINAGAEYTNSKNVTLDLTATAGENPLQMSVDNGTTWETFNSARSYTISESDGTITITVCLKDSKGNQSAAITDSIILDTTAYSISNISSEVLGTDSVKIIWTSDIDSTDFINYGLKGKALASKTADIKIFDAKREITLTGLLGLCNYEYLISSTDNLGNVAQTATQSFVVNKKPNFIVYYGDETGGFHIYRINLDGSNKIQITNTVASNAFPALSWDRSKITYSRHNGTDPFKPKELRIIDIDGQNDRLVYTSARAGLHTSIWHPNDNFIYFADHDAGNRDIAMIKSDGTGYSLFRDETLLLAPGNCDAKGEIMVFDRMNWGNAYSSEIYKQNLDGTGATRLTFTGSNDPTHTDYSPVISPDGKNILWNTYRDGNFEIYIMDSDGNNKTNLTNHASNDEGAVWIDNEKFVFFSDRSGGLDIYLLKKDGTGLTQITDTPFRGVTRWGSTGASAHYP
ncbi:TolB family protein [Candidatus Riflebacteria bacterium]